VRDGGGMGTRAKIDRREERERKKRGLDTIDDGTIS